MALYLCGLVCCSIVAAPIDHVEVAVSSTAYLWLHHNPIYTAIGDYRRYSLLYGPICYLPYSLALFLFGDSLSALKAAVVFANASLFAVLWVIFRRLLPVVLIVIPFGFIAAGMMSDQTTPFLIRGDVGVALGVALSLLFATRPKAVWNGLGFAVASACVIDIKITAIFYLLIPGYFIVQRYRRHTLFLFLSFVAAAVAPFSLPGVSLTNYVRWLLVAAHHPFDPHLLTGNLVVVGVLMIAPGLMLVNLGQNDFAKLLSLARGNRSLALLIPLGLIGSVLTGSKAGAGFPHLNPWYIYSAYASAYLWRLFPRSASLLPKALAIYAILLIVPASSETAELLRVVQARWAWTARVNLDIDRIMRDHPGKAIAMSYEEPKDPYTVTDLSNRFSTRLVFSGEPLIVDEAALADMSLAGLQIPASTVSSLSTCDIQIWLAAKGSEPFDITNVYARLDPSWVHDPHLFSENFRMVFFSHYTKVSSSNYYDLWECSAPQ